MLATVGMVAHPGRAQSDSQAPSSSGEAEVSQEEFRIAADEKTAAEIAALIPKLDAPGWLDRQSATDRLKEIGAPAFPTLRETYLGTDELEVRLRVEEIIRGAYMDHHVFSRHPFLGVQLGMVDTRPGKGVVPPATTPAVQIKKVFENSAAERAGLKENDVLIAQDGMPLRGTGGDLVTSFSQGIARRTPGSRLAVTLLRESGPEEIEIILGRLPPETAQAGRFVGLPEKIERAKERFDPWWDQHFRKPSERARGTTAGDR